MVRRCIAALCFLISMHGSAQKTYTLIPQKTGKINKSIVAALSPSLKALAAFYAAMGGTNCMELQCGLTTALGLGRQGSEAQKNLILKYFPNDKAAKLVVGQDCYLSPSSSSSFSDFKWLAFLVRGDDVQVNYQLMVYDHGRSKMINGPDVYHFKSQAFTVKKRVLYAWTSK